MTVNLTFAFACPLSAYMVIYVELMIVFHVVNLCIITGFINVWLKVNALLLINLLTYNNHQNVDIFYLLKETKSLLGHINLSISHILQEGNKCPNDLTNLGSLLPYLTCCDLMNMPKHLKGFVNLDKIFIPYIRNN